MKKDAIDIIGTGESALAYDWTCKNTRWSIASANKSYGVNVDLYFCMHDGEKVEGSEMINQATYPLDKIVKKYNSRYFNCSIAYMVAYALYKGFKTINIYGVDMAIGGEYQYERPSVMYWIGRAESKGVEVNTTINNAHFLYGYESARLKTITDLFDLKRKYAKSKISTTSGDEMHQWIGRLHTINEIENIMRT